MSVDLQSIFVRTFCPYRFMDESADDMREQLRRDRAHDGEIQFFRCFAEYSLAICFAVDAVAKIPQDGGERACLDRSARCWTSFRSNGRTLARAAGSRASGTVVRHCTFGRTSEIEVVAYARK